MTFVRVPSIAPHTRYLSNSPRRESVHRRSFHMLIIELQTPGTLRCSPLHRLRPKVQSSEFRVPFPPSLSVFEIVNTFGSVNIYQSIRTTYDSIQIK